MLFLLLPIISVATAASTRLPPSDIRYTKCQADILLEKYDYKVPPQNIDQNIECDRERAIDANVANGEIPLLFDKIRENGWLIVPFYFDNLEPSGTHSEEERSIVRKKLLQFEEHTCIKVREVTRNDTFYEHRLRITRKDEGCWSYVGAQTIQRTLTQQINLGPGCTDDSIPQHEVMHALGFWHEQQRGDRDDYVDLHRINCNLTDDAWQSNFEKVPWLPSPHVYDYNSVMQYSGTSCSNASFPSITYHGNATVVEPDNADGLSDIDIEQINFLYNCDHISQLKTSFAEFGVLVTNKFIPHFLSYQGLLMVENPKLDLYLAKWYTQINHLVRTVVDPLVKPRKCTDYNAPVGDHGFIFLHDAYIQHDDPQSVVNLYDYMLIQGFQNCTRPNHNRTEQRKRKKMLKLSTKIKRITNRWSKKHK